MTRGEGKMTKYFYTHIFFNATEIAFQGNRLDAEKIALKYNMRIKEERKGYIVLLKDAAAEIFEHDENENIVRSVDPRPYLIKNGSEADLTEKEVENLVDDLNAGFVHFGELWKAETDSKKT